eukprot:3870804-Pleurochrysis_carterae.AAC.3
MNGQRTADATATTVYARRYAGLGERRSPRAVSRRVLSSAAARAASRPRSPSRLAILVRARPRASA